MNWAAHWWKKVGLTPAGGVVKERRVRVVSPRPKVCSVGGCGRQCWAKGKCHRHYTRARRAAGRIAVKPGHRVRQALGRGVCSSCSTVQPLFAVGKNAKCRECIDDGH